MSTQPPPPFSVTSERVFGKAAVKQGALGRRLHRVGVGVGNGLNA